MTVASVETLQLSWLVFLEQRELGKGEEHPAYIESDVRRAAHNGVWPESSGVRL